MRFPVCQFTGDDVIYLRNADTGPDMGPERSHWFSDCSSG